MKKLMLLLTFAVFGMIGCSGCDDGGDGPRRPPVVQDHVSIRTNVTNIVTEYIYSLSTPPAVPIPGEIPFAVTVVKDNSSLSLNSTDITWTSTGDNVGTLSPVPGNLGAYLTLNNTTGNMVVKATYLDGTIDEMSASVTIHVVP